MQHSILPPYLTYLQKYTNGQQNCLVYGRVRCEVLGCEGRPASTGALRLRIVDLPKNTTQTQENEFTSLLPFKRQSMDMVRSERGEGKGIEQGLG